MKLVNTAQALLMDAKLYLEQIDAKDYSKQVELLFQSSIGQHSRHFIEFFQCLFTQVSNPERIVNYDKRLRNRLIESDPAHALQAIDELLEQMVELDIPEDVVLEACFPEEEVSIPSSFERELLYNIEHTIHHLAIIKIGLRAIAPQIDLPEHFGVAASTIKFRKEACVQ
ncbi:MAG: DinB family protein [Bacteroidota bacterium]